jgi:hypothetical protein
VDARGILWLSDRVHSIFGSCLNGGGGHDGCWHAGEGARASKLGIACPTRTKMSIPDHTGHVLILAWASMKHSRAQSTHGGACLKWEVLAIHIRLNGGQNCAARVLARCASARLECAFEIVAHAAGQVDIPTQPPARWYYYVPLPEEAQLHARTGNHRLKSLVRACPANLAQP